MTLKEYQDKAYSTALPEARNANYMLLGLVNEAGEIAGAVKKCIRGDYAGDVLQEKLKKEIGDTLWYLAGLATTLELRLDDIAQENLNKLQDRMTRGKLRGDGDNR